MNPTMLSRYEQAQHLLQGSVSNRVVLNDAVFPHWINNSNSFWYIRETHQGKAFRLFNAETTSNTQAFDHGALAKALSDAAGRTASADDLPLREVSIDISPLTVRFEAYGKHWLFDAQQGRCNAIEAEAPGVVSPDGKQAVFVRDYNLWSRDQATGKEQALTEDGTSDYYYVDPQISAEYPIYAQWSPDSKYLFASKVDAREIAQRPFIQYNTPTQQPALHHFRMSYPGDEHTEANELFMIDVAAGEATAIDHPPLFFSPYGEKFDLDRRPLAWWSKCSALLYFVDIARGADSIKVVELDVQAGTTRVLMEEASDTFVKLTHGVLDPPLLLPLPESNELIWFSESDNWGHLCLYDLTTGALKQTLTEGEWVVRKILHYDASRRELLVQTAGRDAAINPYYCDICRVNIYTGELTPVMTGDMELSVYQGSSFQVLVRYLNLTGDTRAVDGVSPNAEYIVVTRSRVDMVPESVLIDRDGNEIATIETADASALPDGWNWPEPVKLKAADGETDIYGVVYRPPGFSPDQSYPVIDYAGGFRGNILVPQGSFINGYAADFTYLWASAYAALGFVVVAIEGRGTPLRDKAFLDHHYGDPASICDVDDRIAGMRQLAERYPYMDLDRVGVTGVDGLENTVHGMLDHPDFYKVGIAHCYMDSRSSYPFLAESYDGVLPGKPRWNGAGNVEDRVDQLQGKLMLVAGLLDFVALSGTFRLIDALQEANKDFEFICMPSKGHDIHPYAERRSWDYLIQHLQGIEPPREFKLTNSTDLLQQRMMREALEAQQE